MELYEIVEWLEDFWRQLFVTQVSVVVQMKFPQFNGIGEAVLFNLQFEQSTYFVLVILCPSYYFLSLSKLSSYAPLTFVVDNENLNQKLRILNKNHM